MKDAAVYYRASLAVDPDNKDLLALSFFFSTSAGESPTRRSWPSGWWRRRRTTAPRG